MIQSPAMASMRSADTVPAAASSSSGSSSSTGSSRPPKNRSSISAISGNANVALLLDMKTPDSSSGK
jgi:hypothetical protein